MRARDNDGGAVFLRGLSEGSNAAQHHGHVTVSSMIVSLGMSVIFQ